MKIKAPNIKAEEKTIVVVGLPATGKSVLTEAILKEYSNRKIKVFRTDDYLNHGFEKSLYVLMDLLKKDISPIKLIEGVQGYRLLRKGIETGTFHPDLVIVCCATREVRIKRYEARGKKLNKGFDTILEKIWQDYIHALSQNFINNSPRFIMFDTLTGKARHA